MLISFRMGSGCIVIAKKIRFYLYTRELMNVAIDCLFILKPK